MSSIEYRVVPFIGQLKRGGTASEAASQLQAVISEHVAQGWDLYQLGDVNIEIQPGCLAALTGQSVSYVRYNQLIFRRVR